MVLNLKVWKSRSLPGLPRTLLLDTMIELRTRPPELAAVFACGARDGAVADVELPSADEEAAAVFPRRLFFLPG
jgi:hypothetical protein